MHAQALLEGENKIEKDHNQDLFSSRGRGYRSVVTVSANCILILLWQLETLISLIFRIKKVHCIGITTVAREVSSISCSYIE